MVYPLVVARLPKTARFAARLTEECKALMDEIAAREFTTASTIVEKAIREYASRRGITLSGTDKGQQSPPSRQRDVPRTGDGSD